MKNFTPIKKKTKFYHRICKRCKKEFKSEKKHPYYCLDCHKPHNTGWYKVKCKKCGKEFKGTKRSKYCKECKKSSSFDWQIERLCSECNSSFMPATIKQRRCFECIEQAEKEKGSWKKLRLCPDCSTLFMPTSPRRIFCFDCKPQRKKEVNIPPENVKFRAKVLEVPCRSNKTGSVRYMRRSITIPKLFHPYFTKDSEVEVRLLKTQEAGDYRGYHLKCMDCELFYWTQNKYSKKCSICKHKPTDEELEEMNKIID